VKDGINGIIFQDAIQLAGHLEVGLILCMVSINTDYASQTLLTYFPSSPKLDSLRKSLQRASQVSPNVELRSHIHEHQEGADWEWSSWSDNWNRVVKPLVLNNAERFS
jgi:beta-1,4-mannosyltransferase